MSALKVIYHEACYREDLSFNPTLDVGIVKENRKERGHLTVDELKLLFPIDYLTVWTNKIDYTCFFIAASTGMRRGEVLALRWKHVNFDKNEIRVEESWKDADEIGLPKWDKARSLFMPDSLKQRLLLYKDHRIANKPDDLIIANIDGTRLKNTWWKKHFEKALIKSGIKYQDRNITPHSLRHTLNSIMLAAGENPDKIRSSFGWNSQKVQDNYTHWDSQNFKNQGDIVDSLWLITDRNTELLN